MKETNKRKIGMITGGIVIASILIAIIWAIAFPNPLGPSIRRITSIISTSVIIVGLLIIALFIYRAKKNKRVKKIATVLLSFVLILVVFANVMIGNFHVILNQLLDRNTVTAEQIPDITARAKELTERLEAEGLVLLKNEGNALPLNDKNVNIFGYASQSIMYGGAGSGAADETSNVTFQGALENAGFKVNGELIQFYKDQLPKKEKTSVLEMLGGNYNVPEPAVSAYTDELLMDAKNFSETAIVVIGRAGGEGADMPMDMADFEGGTKGRHYMELTENEQAMLSMVEENFDQVVVIINSSSPMELGFIDESSVDAALWIGGPGSTGLNAVGKALSGIVNPSGRLPDTYAYDATSSPAYYNAGDFTYLGSEYEDNGLISMITGDKIKTYNFVNYQEGIYVGYRYYETAAADGFIDYGKTVQFPFGYGLSYTTFEQKMGELKVENDTISVDVTVTNTGDVSGKEVVQLYYTPPYTKGGIEKSHVVLASFDKTEVLEPGQSETITLSYAIEDMSSYDYQNAKAYVLESGDYEIKLMNNSHDIIDSKVYTNSKTITGRRSDLVPATNQFDDAAGEVKYVSRADWAGTMPSERAKDQQITEELMKALSDTTVEVDPNSEDIVFKKHGLKLSDMKGLAYNDPKWNQLLEQLSVKDMEYLIGSGGWQTVAIPSVGKPQVSDIDGPAGLNGLINGTTGNQYTSEVVVAATWNTDLAKEFGKTLGEEAYAKGVSGIYGPAMNTHRTPFSGRNFEYYSEDGLLGGKMGAAMVLGANSTNTYTYIKHFALDDQETNVIGNAVWSNEQAIREIYLKPFEITVKEGGTRAVMSAWNRIGTTWTGNSDALLERVLRDEWGFEGVVITDNSMVGSYMDADQAIDSGNDMMLSSTTTKFDTSDTATGRQNMRRASHNILYTVANSNALELARVGVPTWIWMLTTVDAVLLGLITLGVVGCTKKKKDSNIIVSSDSEFVTKK